MINKRMNVLKVSSVILILLSLISVTTVSSIGNKVKESDALVYESGIVVNSVRGALDLSKDLESEITLVTVNGKGKSISCSYGITYKSNEDNKFLVTVNNEDIFINKDSKDIYVGTYDVKAFEEKNIDLKVSSSKLISGEFSIEYIECK